MWIECGGVMCVCGGDVMVTCEGMCVGVGEVVWDGELHGGYGLGRCSREVVWWRLRGVWMV